MKGLWLLCFVTALPFLVLAEEGVLERKIRLPKAKGSVYEMLDLITKEAGLFFIYDNRTINNEKKVKVAGGEYTIRGAIRAVVDDERIQMRVVGKHILLYRESKHLAKKELPILADSLLARVVEGVVRDRDSKEAIPYVSVSVSQLKIGTITNLEGRFRLKLPNDSLNVSPVVLVFSHLGYVSQNLNLKLFSEGSADVYMEPGIITIPEALVGVVNPQKIVKEMLNKRKFNYPEQPVYLTAFYREGIEQNGKLADLSEAVFKIYKTPFSSGASSQTKLLKMRRISNISERDSLIIKMKAGVGSSLLLDVVKELPDFLVFDEEERYRYAKIGATLTDSGVVHIIAFEQKLHIQAPLYKGELYIDGNSSALLKAHFQVHPDHIEEAENLYIVRKSKQYEIKPHEISYEVTYLPWNGKYYINHVRGDLVFKAKRKKQLFSRSFLIRAYFEMATCRVDTLNVTSFARRETISSKSVFSDTHFTYDDAFWGDLNVILAEEQLAEAIARISVKIEQQQEP